MCRIPRIGWLAAVAISLAALAACRASGSGAEQASRDSDFARQRAALVEKLRREGIRDERILSVIGKLPRHRFVPPGQVGSAYEDYPLPIGLGQTISQPWIVAYMTESLKLNGVEKVLEIGTGSGYQAAVLAETAGQVYSVEILDELSERAGTILRQLGYRNVHLKVGDGFDGWKEHAPYDAIIVTAAPLRVPPPLIAQLKEGGRMSIPMGPSSDQILYTFVKEDGQLVETKRMEVRFVRMTGKAAE
ncbi:MAG: protein-L-isoaspartate(D-aspartate) O-methyltransferase [Deltaproteobacteria bacterium]|nr:protein-L-isoaspartate(D-aspartate) O-methyltransferase [Deltaproteobacteria bacterium]